MRLWTVHPWIVWERLKAEGALYVDPFCDRYNDGFVPWQYRWMAFQLKERVPGYGGGLPWWAYCEKPDLRWVRHTMPIGHPYVRIELQVASAIVLPSWAWDTVFGGQYLTVRQSQQEGWNVAMRKAVPDEDLWPLPEPWRGELEASWLRVFDPDLPLDGWIDVEETPPPRLEAVFETLRLEDVRSVTRFLGASRRALAFYQMTRRRVRWST